MKPSSLAVLVCAIGAAGCVPMASSPSALLESTAPAEPTEQVEPIVLGDLAAGRYTNPAFTPRVDVTMPDGWTTFHLSRNYFDVAFETDDGPVVLAFYTPDAFLTPEGEVNPSTPREAIAALEEHETLTVSDPRDVRIDGIAGLEVDVAATVDNTHIMRTEDGDIGIGPTNDVRFAFFPVGGQVLVIGVLAPEGGMDAAMRLTEAVRASVRIGD